MLFDKLWRIGVTIFIGFTVGVLFSHLVRRNEADHKYFLVALERDSLLAARDTTRTLQAHLASLGDSLHVVSRRAVQTAQRADELDRAKRFNFCADPRGFGGSAAGPPVQTSGSS